MTNSSEPAAAGSRPTLRALLVPLDLDRLLRETWQPALGALETFPDQRDIPLDHRRFLEVAGEFVRHLYWRGKSVPVRLSAAQARAEALGLLETRYEGHLASGYAGAFLDATQPDGRGLLAVLADLATILAQEELRRRTRVVLLLAVDPSDWHVQRRLTGVVSRAIMYRACSPKVYQ